MRGRNFYAVFWGWEEDEERVQGKEATRYTSETPSVILCSHTTYLETIALLVCCPSHQLGLARHANNALQETAMETRVSVPGVFGRQK